MKGNPTTMNKVSAGGQNSYIRTETELQFEIECPRCFDTMELCSDFNGLPYFCEQYGFLANLFSVTICSKISINLANLFSVTICWLILLSL